MSCLLRVLNFIRSTCENLRLFGRFSVKKANSLKQLLWPGFGFNARVL